MASTAQAKSHPPKSHGGHATKPKPKPKPKHHKKHHAKHRVRGGHAKKLGHLKADGGKGHQDQKKKEKGHSDRKPRQADVLTAVRTLDGSGNNVAHATWGQAGTPYPRVGPANYADGASAMPAGPPPRRISNRVFNDIGQNLFSENDITQWGWVWGQFLDHDIGLRDETPAEDAAIPFDANDPLEQFANDLGKMSFNRTPAAPGTGTSSSNPRQQINTNSSVIDASQIYGGTAARLAWLKAPNGYDLFLPNGNLPHTSDKPGAPVMDLDGAADG